jgi:hypothetical protein
MAGKSNPRAHQPSAKDLIADYRKAAERYEAAMEAYHAVPWPETRVLLPMPIIGPRVTAHSLEDDN